MYNTTYKIEWKWEIKIHVILWRHNKHGYFAYLHCLSYYFSKFIQQVRSPYPIHMDLAKWFFHKLNDPKFPNAIYYASFEWPCLVCKKTSYAETQLACEPVSLFPYHVRLALPGWPGSQPTWNYSCILLARRHSTLSCLL